jgi:PhzF family phenazine biosynthesis protein
MKKYKIYQIDAFTEERFKGNPAGVVPNADGLTETQMLMIARELNNSETAFIFSAKSPDYDVHVRFFTPTTEVPICGHATISAHYVRALENKLSPCTVKQLTGAGILPVEIVTDNNDYKIIMTQGKIEFGNSIKGKIRDKIINALGLKENDINQNCPIQVVSTGHSKVIIGINSKKKLDSLQPNMSELVDLTSDVNSKGFFVFTFDSDQNDILTCGRMFAPALGINEDPVTGNANGPLGAYLIYNKLAQSLNGSFSFKGKQGEAIGRPGIVEVNVKVEKDEPVQIQVGGYATVAFKTEIII